jgi:hypothetical protein
MARRPPPGVEAPHRSRRHPQLPHPLAAGRRPQRSAPLHTFIRQGEAVDALRRIAAAGWICHCPTHAPGDTSTKHYGAPVTPAQPQAEVSFGAFATRHVASLTGVGPGYRARFAREMDLHLAPFADRPIADITELDVREWIRRHGGRRPPVADPRPAVPHHGPPHCSPRPARCSVPPRPRASPPATRSAGTGSAAATGTGTPR